MCIERRIRCCRHSSRPGTQILATQSAEPFFAKVVESQKALVKRVVSTQFELEVDQKMAYDHFFPA